MNVEQALPYAAIAISLLTFFFTVIAQSPKQVQERLGKHDVEIAEIKIILANFIEAVKVDRDERRANRRSANR